MTKKRIAIIAAVAALVLPAAVRADIVFDPTNFAEAIIQVVDAIEQVDQLYQEIDNEVAMIKGWNFSQLPDLLQNMDVWQQVFGQGSTYSSSDPGGALDNQYPTDPSHYANMNESSFLNLQSSWDQQERSVLVENRTVQNDTYQSFQPTAQRMQQYVDHSNSASGATAAIQAGNEELATLVAQIQALQAMEITDARAEAERDARRQAEAAYAQQQQQAVRGDWSSPSQPSSSLVNAFPNADQ